MKRILVVVLIMLTTCTPRTKEKPPIPAPQDFSSIRSEIIQLVKDGKTPSFSVAVLQDGKLIWKEVFEQTGDTSTVSILSDAQYPIASMTKSMTATVLLKLVEKGQISLNDPIEKYLPNGVNYYSRNSSTVKELINMTSGIPHGSLSFDLNSPYASFINDSLMANYGMAVFPKGIWEYSNYSFGILEAIIERVTNKTYAQVLQEEIFDPLGMENSFITPNITNKLKNYYSINGGRRPSKFFPSGAAGVFSTLNDLILYARLQMGEMDESIISAASLNQMHYDKINPSTLSALGWGSIALGDDLTWVISDGSFPNSANSNLTIIPEKKIAVICLANKDFNSSATIMAIKTADVLVAGFADKVFAKMEAYESADGKDLKIDTSNFSNWQGVLKQGKTESPIEFAYKSDSLYVSFDNSEWKSIKYATLDHQSIIRGGGLIFSLKNPITNQVEESRVNFNLLVSENKLQGYLSASFRKKNAFHLLLPYYIEAHGKK